MVCPRPEREPLTKTRLELELVKNKQTKKSTTTHNKQKQKNPENHCPLENVVQSKSY